MRKTILSLATIMTIMPAALLHAASLPDEINHPPYYSSYLDIKDKRDSAQASLDGERNNLQIIFNSIQRENDNIARLRQTIQSLENERADLQYELPQVESDLDQTQRKASNTQAVIDDLTYRLNNLAGQINNQRSHLNNLNGQLNEQEQINRNLLARIRGFEQQHANISHAIDQTNKEIQKAERQVADAQTKLKQLTERARQIDSQIAVAQRKVIEANNQIRAMQTEQQKHKSYLEKNVENIRALKAKLARAEGSRNRELIQKIKAEIDTLVTKQRLVQRKLADVNNRLRSANQNLVQAQREVRSLEQEKQKIPALLDRERREIANAKGQQARSRQVLAQKQNELVDIENRLQRIKVKAHQVRRIMADLANEVRNQNAVIQDLEVRYSNLESDISNHRINLASLNDQIADLGRRIRDIQDRIPQITSEINSDHNYIAESERSIDSLELRRGSTENEIATLEGRVANLTSQTNAANDQYQQRRNLYDHYLQEASDIGASQTDPAIKLGNNKGNEISKELSNKYSEQLGSEVGSFEAKLIGMVRSENEGYPVGYQAGHTNTTSRQQGQLEGRSAGRKQAHIYAQQNMKPGFFEKHLKEVLAGAPIVMNSKSLIEDQLSLEVNDELKGYKAFNVPSSVPNLENDEIAKSRSYATSLDNNIEEALISEQQVWSKSRQYADAGFVYEAPGQIPYQTMDCSSVYKDVPDFITECEQSYAAVFKDKFLNEAQEQFSIVYPGQYNEKFAIKEDLVRTQQYAVEFEKLIEVVKSEAQAVGQKDAYNEEYKVAFDNSYAAEMPEATAKADRDAKEEVGSWLASKPLVTVDEHGFTSDVIRGGQPGSLKIVLKNLGAKDSLATGILKITGSKNLSFTSSSYRLGDVAAKQKKAIAIPFTVNANAKSGDLATASVELTLPGDKYKAQRTEIKNFQIHLSVNPTAITNLKFDESPKVKGWRSYYIHLFNFELAPAVEDVSEGYTLKLEAAPGSENLLDFKESSASSGALKKGQKWEGKFRYVFKVNAKGKTVTLFLNTFHKGVLIKKQPITLKPY